MLKLNKKSFIKKNIIYIKILIRYFYTFYFLLKWLFITLIIGTIIGISCAGFLISLNWVTDFRENNFWIIYFLPFAGFFIGLLYLKLGKDIESGNNLLIENIQNPKKIIPLKMAFLIYFTTIITHLFGGSAGREGTAVQMAGSLADQFTKIFRLNKSNRQLILISAISAGFSAVFGTPLAAAIFALEISFIGKINYKAIFPAFISGIISNQVVILLNVHHTQYFIDFIPKINFLTIIYSIFCGIIFGICASIFSKSIHKISLLFKQHILYQPFRPFLGGFIIILGVLLIGNTNFLGLGIPIIIKSFNYELPFYDFILKLIFTILTLSCGFKGGEVTPLFFIGATLGNALFLFIPLPIGLLAAMGFVGVFAGATNTPLACILMGIELFGVESALFIAIVCIVSYLTSGNTGIYKSQIITEPKNIRQINNKGKQINEFL